jgi:hypothetical protein
MHFARRVVNVEDVQRLVRFVFERRVVAFGFVNPLALDFSVGTLGFTLVEDTYIPEQDKRWVVVAPPGSKESRLLLARAVGEEQASRIGNQTGGRVFLFLYTDDFWRGAPLDYPRGCGK